MAQKIVTEFIDDVDGSAAERTFTFSVDGTHYEIDLSTENITEFKTAIGGFIESARHAGKTTKVPRGGGNGKARRDPEQVRAIRRWARKNGYNVGDRGRIPAEALAAYNRGGSMAATG